MTIDFQLLAEERSGGNYFRTVDFRVGSGPFSRFLPTWKNGVPLPKKVEPWWRPLSEIYAKISLAKLRSIDSDTGEQAKFIKDFLTPQAGTVGLPVLNLLLEPGDRISDADVEYLAALSAPPGTVGAVAPLLYNFHYTSVGVARPHEPADPDKYLSFVERFLSFAAASNSSQVQIMLPTNMPFSKVGRLLTLYRDVDASLLMVDAFGTTVHEKWPQVRKIIGVGEKGTHSLREKRGEKFALYAFDTKASTGRGPKVAAQRLVRLDGGYSSFGPLRNNRTMVTDPPKVPPPPRLFVPSDVAFWRGNIHGAISNFGTWCAADGTVAKATPTSILRHTLHSSIRVAREMGDWATSGALQRELDKRSTIRAELKRVRRDNGRIFSTQRTLI